MDITLAADDEYPTTVVNTGDRDNVGPNFMKTYLVLGEDENNEVESDVDPVHTSYPGEDEEAHEGDEELECAVSVSTPEWR